MTFSPVPKADLWSLDDLALNLDDLHRQILSRLHYAEVDTASLLASVVDLYTRLEEEVTRLDATWTWATLPSFGDPGVGKMTAVITEDTNRRAAISKTTSNGHNVAEQLSQLLSPGSRIVLMDSPGGILTAFRIYTVTDTIIEHSTWFEITAQRVVTLGIQDIPQAGTVVRLVIGD